MSNRFRSKDEANAWDKYVAAAMASGLTVEKACEFADCILECRRERYRHQGASAPPADDDKRYENEGRP